MGNLLLWCILLARQYPSSASVISAFGQVDWRLVGFTRGPLPRIGRNRRMALMPGKPRVASQEPYLAPDQVPAPPERMR
jgi:hypothetical protein